MNKYLGIPFAEKFPYLFSKANNSRCNTSMKTTVYSLAYVYITILIVIKYFFVGSQRYLICIKEVQENFICLYEKTMKFNRDKWGWLVF